MSGRWDLRPVCPLHHSAPLQKVQKVQKGRSLKRFLHFLHFLHPSRARGLPTIFGPDAHRLGSYAF